MESSRRYRIVIALDGSEYSEIVVEHALDQAARHDAPDLHFLCVVDDEDDVEERKRWLATLVLEGLDTFRDGRPDWRSRLHVRVGRAAEEIVALAGEVQADLLVLGRYGTQDPRRSSASAIIVGAPCPVLVVGLTDHPIELVPQCPRCVAVREESDGERWFCSAHSGDPRLHSTNLLPFTTRMTHGRMW